MVTKIKYLFEKYEHILFYLIFGVLTTLINVGSYWVVAHLIGCSVMISTIIAWMLAVLFAYLTNRKWVFNSTATTSSAIVKEFIAFITCRIATGIFDGLSMFVFVDLFHFNDILIKLLANIMVIILNYITSKLIIFKHD